jgi:two-component system, OmpR family, response regulator
MRNSSTGSKLMNKSLSAARLNPVQRLSEVDLARPLQSLPLSSGYCSIFMDEGQIIVVDDDPILRELVRSYLTEHDIDARLASNREELNRYLKVGRPRLILLDIKLGKENGLDLLREIRSQSDIPVIVMSGYLSAETDRVIGLELGADDYLVKPFSLRELLARVRAILRRQTMSRAARARKARKGDGYRFGGWKLDCHSRKLFDPGGAIVALTRREYDLLLVFLKSPGRHLSREYLIRAVTKHQDVFDRSIDALILRLRRKIESNPSAPRMIQTTRGIGYVFALPVERL